MKDLFEILPTAILYLACGYIFYVDSIYCWMIDLTFYQK